MCRALGAAHARGSSTATSSRTTSSWCIKADGALQVKILDFGVAKILASPDGASSVKTRTGSLMGTPLYMSPEQCKGAGVLDHRTDIYSLGVILFEMLAGRPPFIAEGVGELFAKHMLEDPPLVTEFAPDAPPHMAAAIMKALAKDPDARFPSMEEFRKAIVGEIKVTRARGDAAVRRARDRGANTMAQTMSARASTTLSSASSEIDDGFEIKPKRTKLFVAHRRRRGAAWRSATSAAAARTRRRRRPRRRSRPTTDGGRAAPPTPRRVAGEEDRHHPVRGRARRAPTCSEERRQGPGRRARRGPARQGRGQGGPRRRSPTCCGCPATTSAR